MPEWVPINLALMKNPLNWLVVFFMVMLPLYVLSVAHKHSKHGQQKSA